MLSIEARALGRKRPLVPSWSVPAPAQAATGQGMSLRDLLEAVVRGEVQAFEEKRQARLFLRALSTKEIEDSAARGKVDMGGKEDQGQAADPDQAFATAL